MVGIVAGLGAVVFYDALRLASYVFLQVLAGYHVPEPVSEGGRLASAHFARPWAIPSSPPGERSWARSWCFPLLQKPRDTARTRPSPQCITIRAACDFARSL